MRATPALVVSTVAAVFVGLACHQGNKTRTEPAKNNATGGKVITAGASGSVPASPGAGDRQAAADASTTDASNDSSVAADSGNAAESGPNDAAEILTQSYDNARTGCNLRESVLNPAKLSALKALGSWPVDGEIYAQVLVASDIEIASQRRSVAIVATMNDSVYAFDADAAPDNNSMLWHQGAMHELGTATVCAVNVGGLNGIPSTPVIDKPHNSVFVVVRDCDSSVPPEMTRCEQRLVQLDLRDGSILHSVAVHGQVSVEAAAKSSTSNIVFDPTAHWSRPGLTLVGHQLIVAFGPGPLGLQHEENFVYHGWVFRYDSTDLDSAPDVFCTTPHGRGGGVWQAGGAPAADGDAVYFTGANGIMNDSKTHPPADWPSSPVGQEDSVVRLPSTQPFPSPQQDVVQYSDTRSYLPAGNVFQYMESGDNGFGSSGPMLVPGTTMLLVGTKAGLVYLLDRSTLHSMQEPLNPFQDLPLQPGHTLYLHSWWGIPVIPQSFAFWRPRTADDADRYGYAFAWAAGDRLRSLRFDYRTGTLSTFATADVPDLKGGGELVVSAMNDKPDSGVLWAATRSETADSPAGQLWALDPLTLKVLWRTSTPAWSKFTPPTIVRGRVLLPSTSPSSVAPQQVLVYGLP